jgi:hypothetical protein
MLKPSCIKRHLVFNSGEELGQYYEGICEVSEQEHHVILVIKLANAYIK